MIQYPIFHNCNYSNIVATVIAITVYNHGFTFCKPISNTHMYVCLQTDDLKDHMSTRI